MARYMTPKEENRIRHAISDRVMHFSPTISPAPKMEEKGEIESLEAAIRYYHEAGKKTLIIQPKYMGSYCDIYLHRDIRKSRFFSRKGYPLPGWVNQEELFEALAPIWSRFIQEWKEGTELILIQAELLPWSAVGKGLIDRAFRGYQTVHQTHCDYIRGTGLSEAVAALRASDDFRQFLEDQDTMSKKELTKKYPNHKIKHFQGLAAIDLPDPDIYQDAIDLYSEQVELYGVEGKPYFKPFNILKMVHQEGREWINDSNLFGFVTVSDDPYGLIDLNEPIEKCIEQAYDYYNQILEKNMEGVVIKPDGVWDPDHPPMFKVRNNDYLQMIYGVKFQVNYDYYLRRRRTGKKMKCSINEWNIAQTLLRIPMSEISPDNEEYTNLIKARILEEDFEAKLDSRL